MKFCYELEKHNSLELERIRSVAISKILRSKEAGLKLRD
jgi:hypothetical protein